MPVRQTKVSRGDRGLFPLRDSLPAGNGRGLAPLARTAAGRHLAGDRTSEGMAQGRAPATLESAAVRRLLLGRRCRRQSVYPDQGEERGDRCLPGGGDRKGTLAVPV